MGDALIRANLPDANELYQLYQVVMKGWPDTKDELPHSVRQYWTVRDELSVSDGIIYKGMRILVPPSLRPEMLRQFHETHLGINKCKRRALEAQYWPGMGQQIEDMVGDCVLCNTYQNKQPAETLRPTPTPERPWQEIASDIFEWKGDNYIPTVLSTRCANFRNSATSTTSFMSPPRRLIRSQMEKRREPYRQLKGCGPNVQTNTWPYCTIGRHH